MAADTAYAKRVLLACNGGADAVSRGVAVGLTRHGCRLVLVGDEGALAATAEEARRSAAGGSEAIAVVGLDLMACDEAAVGAALAAAWRYFEDGGLHALVNCCSYEGEVQDCLSVTEDEYNKAMKVNVITPWLLIICQPGTPVRSPANNDAQESHTIGVADEHIGAVVGRAGRNITKIIQASGARIKISDRGDFIAGTSDRCRRFMFRRKHQDEEVGRAHRS